MEKNMKKLVFLLLIFVLACIIVVFSKFQYDKKLEQAVKEAKVELTKIKEIQERNTPELIERRNYLKTLVAHKDPQLTDLVFEALYTGDEINIVAMGSAALSAKNNVNPWPELLKEKINEVFEEKIVDVKIFSYEEENTFEIIRNNYHLEVAEFQPDILILEPFIWNNIGYVRILDTLNHISIMIRAVERGNENTFIILQPPNPIYKERAIDFQVDAVKSYAAEHELLYFDHWKVWPDQNDVELNRFLTNNHTPNQDGHSIWADYISSYFVKESHY